MLLWLNKPSKGEYKIQYQGSKARFADEIVPIIQKYIDVGGYDTYIEPFCGGCNIIDKISCENKYGFDIHQYLIELLKHIQITTDDVPDTILHDEYMAVKNNIEKYPEWYVGLVGFCASYGNKWFGGYARNSKDDTNGERVSQSIRNIKKQSESLKKISFDCKSFDEISDVKNSVIYCDIPYKDTTKYRTGKFPYEKFYDWCYEMSKHNIVLISEYDMPDEFRCIWEKETVVLLDKNKASNDKQNIRTERLFVVR